MQGWPEQFQGGDRGGHRITGQAEQGHRAQVAKGKGTPGAQEQFPEVNPAPLGQQGPNPIAVSSRNPTGAYHHIRDAGEVIKGLAQAPGLIGLPAGNGDRVTEPQQQRPQQGAIAFPNLAEGALAAWRHQFITADQ